MAHRETDRHRQAFEAWWETDRDIQTVVSRFTVTRQAVNNWIDWFGWHSRADARDAAVRARLDRDAVARRVKMQERHRQLGANLTIRAGAYFAKHEITSARDAVSAAKAGVDIERTAEGLPTEILELWNAPSDTLRARAQQIAAELGAGTDGDSGDPELEGGAAEGADAGCLPPGEAPDAQ